MLKVHTSVFGKTAVLHLQGRIVNGETVLLRNAINSQVHVNSIVLNLALVNTIDAHGLGVMLELREQTKLKGISFKLMNVTKFVGHVLEITRLNTVFEVISQAEFLTAASYRRDPTVGLASCA
jgi:anti-anti-sigma factor